MTKNTQVFHLISIYLHNILFTIKNKSPLSFFHFMSLQSTKRLRLKSDHVLQNPYASQDMASPMHKKFGIQQPLENRSSDPFKKKIERP